MSKKSELVIVPCPSYPEYKEAPSDQSVSELFDCPKCDGKMWLSQKKKGILMFSACLNREIYLACYDCIRKLAKERPDLIRASERMDL